MYSLLSGELESLHELNRYDEFVSVLKCIGEGIMIANIAFQLLMDVGNKILMYSYLHIIKVLKIFHIVMHDHA